MVGGLTDCFGHEQGLVKSQWQIPFWVSSGTSDLSSISLSPITGQR